MARLALAAVAAGGVGACDGGPAITSPCAGIAPEAAPRVVWDAGAEGVRMGDTREDVEARLGPPDGVGYVDWARTQEVLRWSETEPVGFAAVIVRRDDRPNDVGVLFLNALRSLSGGADYAGRTAEGVGIGSTRREVACAYGPLDTTDVVTVDAGPLVNVLVFRADTLAEVTMIDRAWMEAGRQTPAAVARRLRP